MTKDHYRSDHENHHEMMVKDFKKRFRVSLIFTIPVLILSPAIQGFLGLQGLSFTWDQYLLFAISSFIFFYGGLPFLKGLYDELKKKNPGMMTLISVAIVIAYAYSGAVVFGLKGKTFFWELVTLIDVMLLGHWIEMRSVIGASKALKELAKLLPSKAHKLLANGNIQDIDLNKLVIGDIVIVRPGEKISADGEIISGQSSVNESLLTGESQLIFKKEKDKVIGGSINGQGSLTIRVERVGKDSFISQVIKIVRKAQESKSKTQDLANRVAFWLTITSISVGVFTLFFWIFSNKDLAFAIERAVTVMVITCPHALGLAIPLVVSVSTSLGAKNGFLIRNRTAFEQARNVQTVIFDKTGTLTQGKFGISNIILLDDLNEKQVLKYAASIEKHSEHPIARAIADSSKDIVSVKDFKALPGKGARGIVNGKEVMVVSPGYLKENNLYIKNEKIQKLFNQGETVVFVVINQKIKAGIGLADIIRPESEKAINDLKKMGIKSVILTGDNKETAQAVANKLGVDQFFAEVLPEQKLKIIKKIQDQGLMVAMVGDGINDAPALVQADIGIAIGAGTDVAVESADIVLVKNNPNDIVSIINLARTTYSKMKQNLFWATGYNIVAIPLAAGVLYSFGIILSPAVGAVLMSLSTVVVAINARFLKI